MDVLVDAVEDGTVLARSSADAPEIDGQVILESDADIRVGDFIRVTVINADEHDLYAELADRAGSGIE
ncbi:MAG: hypothetical protein PVI91_15540 [Gammaproteobacteria bacterium]|jgi:ribosomal protein S12 methylthiotransferase